MFFPIVIVVSLILFVYYKVQQVKATGLMEKRWYGAKGSIAVGIFIAIFGLNAMINFGTSIATFVGVIFIIYGGINVFFGIKNYQTFLPYAKQEAEELKKQETQQETAKK
ncbi:YtpI family protein [Alteribacter populi]|uniref:YtpI family protein n=1 Tax=Alteribacter populi TaxID=2011011 RepID=UPI0012FE25B2|nr:YtpI family protein [Alteribacter populi]